MRFQEKVAIVTGGNSGIGKEVARRFVAEGGLVVVNGRNAAKTVPSRTSMLPASGPWLILAISRNPRPPKRS
jgi:NAD(P)-dependent dehydrogenase (short-subunit alcohol dehydrogenase family)